MKVIYLQGIFVGRLNYIVPYGFLFHIPLLFFALLSLCLLDRQMIIFTNKQNKKR